ncbi:MAG: TonB-dependent receptor [Paraglaciecola sp.]|uniref:TonB-dependent receptor n=1 Tax=Paraglaciecola sp. TaxID=1920173 RepID=UPI00273D9CFB|nr:TonB-dependent receptor [Paraglaciecola sp.]MDP5031130.1 TonB-dependent receptor [Paraglaciecola sp.]MDP5132788.1 TonB-dependent receptor [Paraglaciecola sp.]
MRFTLSRLNSSISAALALSSYVAISTAALAQEAPKEDQGLLEKITVTAQKRVENLNEVPVAVSVLREDQINAAFAANIEGLQALVPSVSFRKGNTNRNSAITIRGIGTISFSVAAEPSVSTVVDGVVLGRSGQAFIDLYDLERIEVLRGPQGTLFGKNASAGVVNISTKKPTAGFEGNAELSLYQDNEYRLKASVSGELNDNAFGSVTVLKSQFDGYIKNVHNNEMTNGYDKEGVRAMLNYEAAGDTNMLFIFENMKSNDNCCADLELTPSGRHPGSEALPNSTGSGDFDFDQRKIDHDFETRTIDETTGFSLQIDKPIGSHEFTSITAYRSWDNTELREGDFTSIGGTQPIPTGTFLLHDTGIQNWKQTSQEFRFASPTGNDLEYQVGFFWWKQQSERNFTRDASCSGNLTTTIQNYLSTQLGQDAPTAEQADQFIADNLLSCNRNDIVSATAFMNTEFNNWALFADGKYHINEDFRLLFGMRYTDDEVSFEHNRYNNDEYGRGGIGVRDFATNFDGKTDETNVSVKVGAQFDINKDSMVYATYSQGYKGPAFNVFYNMNPTDTLPIGKESSDAYELGYKFASRDLIFNAAIFRTEIDGFQANNSELLDGVTITRLTNAGSVITQGIEADVLWQVSESFTLSGGFASVDAEVDEFLCPVGSATCDGRSGADLPFSPDLKYSVVGEYTWELADMNVILNSSYVYTDEIFAGAPGATAQSNPEALLPDYGILNASLAFSFDDDAYRVTLIGKNLTDESFITTYSGDGFRYQIPRDADRYFGVQFKARF